MENAWMNEAAAEFGQTIREENLTKKAARELTGLSERKARQLVDFVKSLTDEEFETTFGETAEDSEPAKAEETEVKELTPLKRAIRSFRQEKMTADDLTTVARDHLKESDPTLFAILDKRASHFAVESAGYKWTDIRVEVPADEMESIDAHLATNLKEHGKLAPSKYYKANKIETDDGQVRFTFQLRVY